MWVALMVLVSKAKTWNKHTFKYSPECIFYLATGQDPSSTLLYDHLSVHRQVLILQQLNAVLEL